MGSRKKRVAFIPVRGGSKSIPKKNIKKIAGKPLVYWVLEAAIESGVFDDIFISTDDEEIARVIADHCLSHKLNIIKRSKATATDTATTESAMLEFADKFDFDIIALLQATSPLLTGDDLKGGMKKFINTDVFDSLLSVCRQERFIWEEKSGSVVEAVNYSPSKRPRRQEFNGFLVENGAFYITRRDHLLNSRNRLSGNVGAFEMSAVTYYELDEPSDWPVIEKLLRMQESSISSNLNGIKLFLSDVDGVLTDAGMYYSEGGDELKKFNTRDGKGFEVLRKNGIEVGIITSEDTRIVADRAKKLKIDILHQGILNKDETLNNILGTLNITANQVAYIGDDINDLSIIRQVGFSACPADAMDSVKDEVDYICKQKGGEGCVREISELILKLQ